MRKRLILAALSFVLLPATAVAADHRIPGGAVYTVLGRGLTWASGVNQTFVLDVVSPSSGMCLNVHNNDVSSHAYVVTPWITSDLQVTTYTGNTGAWTATNISPSGTNTTLAAATDNYFINTSGAAHVTVIISGGSGAGTADLTIAQTPNQCGNGGIGSIGQAVSCNKHASLVVATATIGILVASPPAGQFVHVCAYSVSGGSATGATHNFGTGAAGACGSISSPWGLSSPASSAPMQFSLGAGIGQLFQTMIAAQPLCMQNGGSGSNLLSDVSYTVF